MSVNLLLIVFVLIVIAMIAFILVQKGAGATAGSAFGSGASSTVFGSKGSGNFLTKSTMILAFLFFAISLLMAVNASKDFTTAKTGEVDLGVIGKLDTNNSDVPSISPVSGESNEADADVPALEVETDTSVNDVPAVEAVQGMASAINDVANVKTDEIKTEANQKIDEIKEAAKDKADELKTEVIKKAEDVKDSIDG